LLQIVLVNVLYQNLDDNAFIALDLKKYSRTLAIIYGKSIQKYCPTDFAENQTL
jgi:hypothetical protein